MPWYSPYDSPTPRKKRKDPPPPPPSLTRVDTLTPNDIRVHLDAYFDAIDRKTTRELRFDGHTHGVGLVTLNTLYFERAFLTPRDVTVPHLFDRVKQRQRLYEVMAWKLLREKYRQRYFSRVKRNNLATCADVLGRAASFLMVTMIDSTSPHLRRSCWRSWKDVCESYASSKCQSGHGFCDCRFLDSCGIFESEALVKNLLGLNVDSDETWPFTVDLTRRLLKLLKRSTLEPLQRAKEEEESGTVKKWKNALGACSTLLHHPSKGRMERNGRTITTTNSPPTTF